MKAASFTSLDSWLFTINIQTHRSFRSYNLRSTIAIRRSLRQSFLKKVYIHIPRKLNMGTAGVAISTDGQQIASNETQLSCVFNKGLVLRYALLMWTLYITQFFTSFFIGLRRICLHAKELNLVVIICSLVVGIDCVADKSELEWKLRFLEEKHALLSST